MKKLKFPNIFSKQTWAYLFLVNFGNFVAVYLCFLVIDVSCFNFRETYCFEIEIEFGIRENIGICSI